MPLSRKRSAAGNAAKRHKAQPRSVERKSELEAARRNLAAAKLEAYIAAVVAESGPLSPAQLEKLALLLRGAS